MVTDTASLKMAFDAAMDSFVRFHLRQPRRRRRFATQELRDVYGLAYALAFRRAATFEEADDPSLISTPPEFDEIPYAEAWSKGVRDGDLSARGIREVILVEVGAKPRDPDDE